MEPFEFEKDRVLLILLVRIRRNLLDDDVVGVDEDRFVTHNQFFVFGSELLVLTAGYKNIGIAYIEFVRPHSQKLLLPGFVLTKFD